YTRPPAATHSLRSSFDLALRVATRREPVSWMQNRSDARSLRASRACSMASSSGSISRATGPNAVPAAATARVAVTAISSRFMMGLQRVAGAFDDTPANAGGSRTGADPQCGIHLRLSRSALARSHLPRIMRAHDQPPSLPPARPPADPDAAGRLRERARAE